MVGRAEQGRETGGGVEPGHAEPVKRTVAPDQGRRVGVTYKGVVLDPLAHCGQA